MKSGEKVVTVEWGDLERRAIDQDEFEALGRAVRGAGIECRVGGVVFAELVDRRIPASAGRGGAAPTSVYARNEVVRIELLLVGEVAAAIGTGHLGGWLR